MEISKNKINLYSSLGQVKMRRRHGLFAAEGIKSVSDSLSHFELESLIILKGTNRETLPFALSRDEIKGKVVEADASVMKKISSLSTPSEVMAVFHIPEVDEQCLKIDKNSLYLILDGVRDPGNMGTIIRTAHWFGIKKIFASMDCVDVYNPKTVQSTMGSLGVVDIIYCDIEELIDANPGMSVYGTLLDGENIYEAKLGQSGFIVMGNEGKGLTERIEDKVTDRLLIPPYDASNHSESLNVAVATAVVLALFRSR